MSDPFGKRAPKIIGQTSNSFGQALASGRRHGTALSEDLLAVQQKVVPSSEPHKIIKGHLPRVKGTLTRSHIWHIQDSSGLVPQVKGLGTFQGSPPLAGVMVLALGRRHGTALSEDLLAVRQKV